MKHYVLCLVDTDEAAQTILQALSRTGFAKEETFVLTSPGQDAEEIAGRQKAEGDSRESTEKGVGLLAGIGPEIVGGSGHFIGPRSAVGASNRGELGVQEGESPVIFDRFGLSEAAARQYQSRLAEGGTLIAVQAEGNQTAAARKIFEEAHAQEISEV